MPHSLTFTTAGGLQIHGHCGLIGGPAEVLHQQARFAEQADAQGVPILLLGAVSDGALLDVPDILNLSAVRTHALPPIMADTSPMQLRDQLTEASEELRSLLGQPQQLLLLGRHLSPLWPFIFGRLPTLSQQGVTVVADVRQYLRSPLPDFFRQFLVWPDGEERFGRAVERWQRHQRPQAYVQMSEPNGQSQLWQASNSL